MNDERKQLLAELRTIRSRADEIGRRLAELDEEDETERNARTRRRAFYAVPAMAIVAGVGFVTSKARKHPGTAATGAVALAAVSAFLVMAQGDHKPPTAAPEPPGIHATDPPGTRLALPPSITPTTLVPGQRASEQPAPVPAFGDPVALRSSQSRPVLVSVHTSTTTTPPVSQQPDPPPVSQQPDPPPTGPPESTPPPVIRRCSPLLKIRAPVLDLRLCVPRQ